MDLPWGLWDRKSVLAQQSQEGQKSFLWWFSLFPEARTWGGPYRWAAEAVRHLLLMINSSRAAPSFPRGQNKQQTHVWRKQSLSWKRTGMESGFVFLESLGKRLWHNHPQVQDKWTQKVLRECGESDGFYWSALPWVSSGNASAPSSQPGTQNRLFLLQEGISLAWNMKWGMFHSHLGLVWCLGFNRHFIISTQISPSIKYWFIWNQSVIMSAFCYQSKSTMSSPEVINFFPVKQSCVCVYDTKS